MPRLGHRPRAQWKAHLRGLATEASPFTAGVRLTWSDDAGKTWAPAVLASQKVLDANYPALSTADDGRVELVFQGRDPEKQAGWSTTSAAALGVARELVLYLRRAGGQSQFSAALALQASDRKQIEDIRTWVIDNLSRDLRVTHLAAKAGMSPRNFARVFLNDTGLTPARFVERSRVEAARRRLEESHDKLEKVASDCGLGSVQRLRRSFQRVLHVPPSEYRSRFKDDSPSLERTHKK